MWLLPLLVLGAIAYAATRRSPREQQRQLPPGPPSPIAVLGEFVRVGQVPPPPVIMCAIAEAEALGRNDVASEIVRIYVLPVVYQHAVHNGLVAPVAPPPPPRYERGSCALPQAPRAAVPAAIAPTAIPSSDEEIRSLINSDPKAFFDLVSRVYRPVIDVPPVPAVPPPPVPAPAPTAPAPTTDPGSPIGGIPDDAWRALVAQLSRESPSYNTDRHVGQYRQRRDRLAELGIDPNSILGSAPAQRAALDHDLADAHARATESGLIDDHLGRALAVPGAPDSTRVSLSGLFGLIQCAGIDGAEGWLERPGDRSRYPNTTQTFLRTNGVF